MKTALVSLCWLDGPKRIIRNQKWLEYNLAIKDQLGFDDIILLDNASPFDMLGQLPKMDNLHILRFGDHLPRTGIQDIPYCWRGMDMVKLLTYKYDKLLLIDSDCYILTSKLANYVKQLESGYVATWCPKYGFPEAALAVLCKDQFQRVRDLPIPTYTHYNGQPMELLLPFTYVAKEFVGDRYGEGSADPQSPNMDFYCQWSPASGEMEFDKK